MRIAGFQKSSFVDYPGKIAAVVFTQGCNMNCYYCHNRGTCLSGKCIDEVEFTNFICRRRGLLDAIVISGGEPTLQTDLIEFINFIKSQGFLVKLDTNGTNPKILKKLICLQVIDYIAMDIKAPLNQYSKIPGCEGWDQEVIESANIIKNSSIPHQFRTTLAPQLTDNDVSLIKNQIGEPIKWQKCNL